MPDQQIRCRAAFSLHLDLQGLQGGVQVIHGCIVAQDLGLGLSHLTDVILRVKRDREMSSLIQSISLCPQTDSSFD